ncbi:DUF882 domain-containing protein [Belnapia sp. T6]|uniref:Murein endopeptidase K n=1 Tax=Belnapia mucosa TaxID=2804532 RepID=A0ABS1V979_9PROT|nr:DUF882 domain-containing protein [Belnapia mucosa]MBL6456893.1 DUF882 domain-containing protein [Belnapia mucosa]
MHRRTLLIGALAPVASAQATTIQRPPLPRRLDLRHAATGARFRGPYHDGRAVDPVALAELSQVLADSRTGTVHAYDPTVIDILWEIGQRMRWRGEFLVVSGFRTPETNAAVCGAGNSQHLRASALDVCVAAAQFPGFTEAALGLRRGGVGAYASKSFVHIDSGPVRRWGDVPGGPAGAAAPRPAPEDPLARIAEAWAATRTR